MLICPHCEIFREKETDYTGNKNAKNKWLCNIREEISKGIFHTIYQSEVQFFISIGYNCIRWCRTTSSAACLGIFRFVGLNLTSLLFCIYWVFFLTKIIFCNAR